MHRHSLEVKVLVRNKSYGHITTSDAGILLDRILRHFEVPGLNLELGYAHLQGFAIACNEKIIHYIIIYTLHKNVPVLYDMT